MDGYERRVGVKEEAFYMLLESMCMGAMEVVTNCGSHLLVEKFHS
jgi:hypothetical protein